MSPMATARAAVAGMLTAVLVLWAVRGFGEDLSQPEVVAVIILLGVIVLLIVPDAVGEWRRLRGKRDEE